jgi:hypothetical protein
VCAVVKRLVQIFYGAMNASAGVMMVKYGISLSAPELTKSSKNDSEKRNCPPAIGQMPAQSKQLRTNYVMTRGNPKVHTDLPLKQR